MQNSSYDIAMVSTTKEEDAGNWLGEMAINRLKACSKMAMDVLFAESGVAYEADNSEGHLSFLSHN